MKNVRNIAITGASSGLGAALAVQLARHGATLHLHGRSRERLEKTAVRCRQQGAVVHCQAGDVCDTDAMYAWLHNIDRAAALDLVIANAGISAGTGKSGESDAQAREIFAANINGVLNTIHPVIPLMAARGRGQIALMSSLAGIRGLPSAPAYSSSKAWVRFYGEGLRGWLAQYGIKVSVICPGYIKTPMTETNDFPMPFVMEADKAARIIARGLSRNRARIAFPKRLYWPLWLISCLPPSWTDGFFARLPGKSSFSEIGASPGDSQAA